MEYGNISKFKNQFSPCDGFVVTEDTSALEAVSHAFLNQAMFFGHDEKVKLKNADCAFATDINLISSRECSKLIYKKTLKLLCSMQLEAAHFQAEVCH